MAYLMYQMTLKLMVSVHGLRRDWQDRGDRLMGLSNFIRMIN